MKNKIICIIVCLMLAGCGCPSNVVPVINTGNTTTYIIKSETRVGSQTLIEAKQISQEEADKLKEEETVRAGKAFADELRAQLLTSEAYMRIFRSFYSLDKPSNSVYTIGNNNEK